MRLTSVWSTALHVVSWAQLRMIRESCWVWPLNPNKTCTNLIFFFLKWFRIVSTSMFLCFLLLNIPWLCFLCWFTLKLWFSSRFLSLASILEADSRELFVFPGVLLSLPDPSCPLISWTLFFFYLLEITLPICNKLTNFALLFWSEYFLYVWWFLLELKFYFSSFKIQSGYSSSFI